MTEVLELAITEVIAMLDERPVARSEAMESPIRPLSRSKP